MASHYIEVVLNYNFIDVSSKAWEYKLRSDERYSKLTDEEKKEYNTLRGKNNSTVKAVEMVRYKFRHTNSINKIITEKDLLRSYHIKNKLEPTDGIGVIYFYIITRIGLYLKNSKGISKIELKGTSKEEKILELYASFLKWIEDKDYYIKLIESSTTPLYVDYLFSLFASILETMCKHMPYLQQLFIEDTEEVFFKRR